MGQKSNRYGNLVKRTERHRGRDRPLLHRLLRRKSPDHCSGKGSGLERRRRGMGRDEEIGEKGWICWDESRCRCWWCGFLDQRRYRHSEPAAKETC